MSVTHLVEEGCIGDHHGNLTGGIEAVQPPPVSKTVESTGPTNHSSTVLSPHPVCVCVCVWKVFLTRRVAGNVSIAL